MKAVMVMFDSLNRHFLSTYGCDWTHAPNFARLAERTVTFDRSYVCSMPCMPARRDFHTARPNLFHTSWCPLQPFDDSVPQMISKAGVQTHLCTDHYHYFEDGGLFYNTRYNTWQFCRGQEGDPFYGQVAEPDIPEHINGKGRRQDWVNRPHIQRECDMPTYRTFRDGIDYLERNAGQDNWFLTIEAFDPHEPFFCDRKFHDLYKDDYEGPVFDWPPYAPATDYTQEQITAIRHKYAALLSACDARLGDVLDVMDRRGLWDDTMFILWTDHGHLLGEHGLFAKNYMPWFEELSHTPLFMWDPRHPETAGQRRGALVQPALDLGPTLLELFGVDRTECMTGQSLTPVITGDQAVRDAAAFGNFGNHLCVTDGRYTYYRAVEDPDAPLYNHLLNLPRGCAAAKVEPPTAPDAFAFTRGYALHRIKVEGPGPSPNYGHLLFDLETDPKQQAPLEDDATAQRLIGQLKGIMADAEAPAELYTRYGLGA